MCIMSEFVHAVYSSNNLHTHVSLRYSRIPAAVAEPSSWQISSLMFSVSNEGFGGVPSQSFAARLAAFLCSRLSAFARCFSCRLNSFCRFWKVIDIGLLGKLRSILPSGMGTADRHFRRKTHQGPD